MTFTALDWLILTIILVAPVGIGILRSKLASRNLSQYFLAGQSLPWWLSGTSMVATTFAADTPLAITGLIAAYGLAGNWLWWNAALGSVLTVVFFTRLWRRVGVLTDVEFIELRYTGRSAAILRGTRALWLGIPVNCLIIGWVNLAMAKILSIALGWNQLDAVFVGLALAGIYSAITGLRGVVIADFMQFFIAMVGTSALAYFVLKSPDVGGIDGLLVQLPSSTFDLWPASSDGLNGGVASTIALPLSAFIAYLGIQWWSTWYPGQEPGGGGYIAQRIMATRSERDALLATWWFTVAHYCIRPWPWILVALASLALYPGLSDPESGYVLVIRDYLPVGWAGLVIGAFFAAFMSTVSTQLNWGTSYVVNDWYKRFINPAATEERLIVIARVVTLFILILSASVTFVLESVRQAWEIMLESGAGIGLVLIMRWYWWRVTAVSEIAAILASTVGFIVMRTMTTVPFPNTLFYIVPGTTICWVLVTLLTSPEPIDRLIAFYEKVRPSGPGWAPVVAEIESVPAGPLLPLFYCWVLGALSIYAALIGIYEIIFDTWLFGGIFVLASVGLMLVANRLRPNDASD